MGVTPRPPGVYLRCECRWEQPVRLECSTATCLRCGLVWLVHPSMKVAGSHAVPTRVRLDPK